MSPAPSVSLARFLALPDRRVPIDFPGGRQRFEGFKDQVLARPWLLEAAVYLFGLPPVIGVLIEIKLRLLLDESCFEDR